MSIGGGSRVSRASRVDVAIVGIACRLPGAEDYDAFWRNLRDGKRSIRQAGPVRAEMDGLNAAGMIDNPWSFDHDFFGLDAADSAWMDPHHRLLLEESWHCVEDSGIGLARLQGAKTAVFTGVTYPDHAQVLATKTPTRGMPDVLGTSNFGAPNRISRLLQLKGKSVNIDSGCASGLVAVHEARNSLSLFDCDYALAATARIMSHRHTWTAYSNGRLLSTDGRCRVFDEASTGFVMGEAVGALLLQRLEDAVAQRSHIYGVIRGTAINHSAGRGGAPTLPSPAVFEEVLRECYADAGVEPQTVDYLELHGVGTPIGDAVEAQAVARVFGERTPSELPYRLGSVKGNIGYSENGSGASGLIKLLLMMKYGVLAPTVDQAQWNLLAGVDERRFEGVHSLTPWPRSDGRTRRAAITAAGAGGVCAHVLVEEGPQAPSNTARGPLPFGLCAPTPQDFDRVWKAWQEFARSGGLQGYGWADICCTQLGRASKGSCRWILLGDGVDDLERALAEPGPTPSPSAGQPGLHFADNDWAGFDVLERAFSNSALGATALGSALALVEELDPTLAHSLRQDRWDKATAQCGSTVGGLALGATLELVGFEPFQISFDGAGVYAALAVAGVIDKEDAIRLALGRARLSELKLARPRCSLLDPVGRRELRSVSVGYEDLESLLLQCQLKPSEFEKIVDRGAYLQKTQFSYRRKVLKWAQALRGAGIELSELFDSSSDSRRQFAEGSSNLAILVSYVLTGAMDDFTERWGLRRQWSVASSQLKQLYHWFRAGALSSQEIAQWLGRPHVTLASVAPGLQERSFSRGQVKPPVQPTLREITQPDQWLALAGQTSRAPASHDNLRVARLADNGLVCFLAESWQRGASISWERVFEGANYRRVPLPGYPFRTRVHRIGHEETDAARAEHLGGPQGRLPRDKELESMTDAELNALFLRLHGNDEAAAARS